MATPMDMLAFLRDALAAALPSGEGTCRVGYEATITPEDYPLIRIVPLRLARPRPVTASQLVREAEVMVYLGLAVHDFEGGTEALWSALFDFERDVIDALPNQGPYLARYVETMTDETMDPAEQNPAFKMLGLLVTVSGLA